MLFRILSRLSRRPGTSSNRPRPVRSVPLAVEALESRHLLTALPYGGIVPGTISDPAASVEFTFSANTGDRFSLAMTSTSTQAGFDAVANVFAPSGENTDSFLATGQRYQTARETGIYTVRVHDSDFAETGTVTLGLEGTKPISPAPTNLLPGGIVGGSIDAPIDVKQFIFSGRQGHKISLAMTSTSTQAGFVAVANVFAPSGENIDDFLATGQRYLTLDEDGTFMVQVHDSDYIQKGSFTIGLEGINPISPSPGALVRGGIVGGAIDAPLDVKQLTFSGRMGDRISLAMTSTSIQAGFVAVANVYAPSGENIDSFLATGQRYYTLDEDGTFMVQVHDSDYIQKGSFTIGLEGIKPISPGYRSLVRGGFVLGTIDAPIDVKQFVFSGRPGDRISLSLTSTSTQAGFVALVNVYAPSGENIDDFLATGQRNLTLDEDGVFMVQVHDSDYIQKGSFKIGLQGINPINPTPRPLVRGGFVTSTITAPIDVKQFTFTARTGDIVALSLTSTATQAGFAAFASVYAPSGTNIDNFFATRPRYITARETGTFIVQVFDSDYLQTGAFKIGLEGIKPPSPGALTLVLGQTRSGAITQTNDVVQYRFSARAGARIRITLTSRATQAGFAAFADIFDASGRKRMSLAAGTRTFVVPVTGVFLLQISDSDFAQRGQFTIRIG